MLAAPTFHAAKRLLTSSVLLFSLASQAQVPGEWGASANGAHADCTDDTCASWSGLYVEDADGGVNVPSASYSLTNSQGTATSSAVYDGLLAEPLLTAFAASNANAFQQGTAVGVQGYTYDAGSPGTITLSTSLTGTNTNPDADALTGLSARVSLVRADAGFLFTYASFVDLLFADAPFVEYEVTANGPVNQSQMVAIDLNPGDQFYVVSTLAASAAGNGASADSSNTLTMEFTVANAGEDPDPYTTLTPSQAAQAVNVPVLPPFMAVIAGIVMLVVGSLAVRKSAAGP